VTDFTTFTGPLTPELAAELRHELRTPVNHIVGYAEMLLEDATQAGAAERQRALEETLGVARDVLTLINQRLTPTDNVVGGEALDALFASLREPQRKIVRIVEGILAAGDTALDGTAVDDLKRILNAAERLAPPPAHVSTAASPVVAAAPAASVVSTAPAPRSSRSPTLLVVDDDEENREVLRRRLEREGYHTECAEDGRRALERIAAEPFDLVLLDVLMPELDGYQVLARLKDTPATRDIPVIVISALDDMASVVRCIERGAEDYLTKPFDPVLLRARISASLEKKRLRDLEVEYIGQVGRVIEAATAIEQGSYRSGALADLGTRDDALGRLARVFDGMAAEVHAREERLRTRLRELRADIGIARTSQEMPANLDGGALQTGASFGGRYQILGSIGRGGLGAVYRAHDRELDEEVAIKTLRPELVADPTVVERFKTEIRLARRISHPNVVRTHDFGEWGGVYYLTMEYVEGITVRELIERRGPLHAPSALAIATQLADSLVVAHAQGVIHRDIKPQNLLLDQAGVLKVMDFGVARLAERTSTLTEAGLVVGTPAYMPPEQLLSETVDARSDLYAVGVVLFECVTGRLPFEATTPVALIAKLLSQEPVAPLEITPGLPPALSALIVKLLAKRPEDRLQTAAELAAQLRRFL
jgi:CheY-like chemotaxis protein